MKIKHKLLNGNDIEIEIQELKAFVNCQKTIQSPFNLGSTFLPKNIEETHEKVVIRCSISEEETTKILLNSFYPQSICVQAIEKYVEQKWSDRYRLGNIITCNHSESQYEYWIEK